jgi:DNA-damage-inducible protein J
MCKLDRSSQLANLGDGGLQHQVLDIELRDSGQPSLVSFNTSCMMMSFTKGEKIMPANQLVQARIDGAIKEEAAAVLAAMGLTVSDAVRLLLIRVAREKALPFAPLVPNTSTIEAMKEARKGGLPQFDGVDALMDELHAQD